MASDDVTRAAAGGESDDAARDAVVVDRPIVRVRRLADIGAASLSALGIALVVVLGTYAADTVAGIEDDVSGIAELLQRLLVAPALLMSAIVTLILPIVVLVDLAVRREPRKIFEVLGAGLTAFVIALALTFIAQLWADTPLGASLSVDVVDGTAVPAIPANLAAVAAMLTTAGHRGSRRALSVSWNVLWFAIVISVITQATTITSGLTALLLGFGIGAVGRYVLGSNADRAYGDALVEGIRDAGIEPMLVVRADEQYAEHGLDPAMLALARSRSGRVYAVTSAEGHHCVAVALDGDQQASGYLSRLWSSIRLRGVESRAEVDLRHTGESVALATFAARGAGVRTARVIGMSHVRDTFLILYQRIGDAVPVGQMEPEEITDEVLDAMWAELAKADAAGMAHRLITDDTVLVEQDEVSGPLVWMTTWELGEVAASDFLRRLDRAQMLGLTAGLVGGERAIDAAVRAVGVEEVAVVTPLVQRIVMPRDTARLLAERGQDLKELRSRVVKAVPTAQTEPENLARFGWRTIVTAVLAIVATFLVITSFRTDEVLAALTSANLWWLLGVFLISLVTFIGAAMALLAFSPVRLPVGKSILVQVAAAYIALVAPAGVGPAALNLRMLTKRGVPTGLGVATVTVIQATNIGVTIIGLIALTLLTGSQGTLVSLPSTPVLIGLGVLVVAVGSALAVPYVRTWAWSRIGPMFQQTWPRLLELLAQPWRLILGFSGHVLQAVGYVLAFDFAMRAFGYSLPIVDIAVLFLLANAVGAVIPTPGGIGAVEGAFIIGLTSAGIPAGVATPIVLIYRLITYWLRIPMGYAAMSYLTRKGEL